jgi:hypothetical protein
MTKDLRKDVLYTIMQIRKQMGENNPAAIYITKAVNEKLCSDKLKDFIKEED